MLNKQQMSSILVQKFHLKRLSWSSTEKKKKFRFINTYYVHTYLYLILLITCKNRKWIDLV